MPRILGPATTPAPSWGLRTVLMDQTKGPTNSATAKSPLVTFRRAGNGGGTTRKVMATDQTRSATKGPGGKSAVERLAERKARTIVTKSVPTSIQRAFRRSRSLYK